LHWRLLHLIFIITKETKMNAFTITPFELESAISGHMRAGVKVYGYWSSDPITVYCRRTYSSTATENLWEVEVSHSTGGRDPKQVESDTQAAKNFGAALIAAAEYAEQFITENAEKCEQVYQDNLARVRREAEEIKIANQKAVDEDPRLGVPQAYAMVAELEEGKMVRMYPRGSSYPKLVTCSKGFKTLFYVGGSRVARKDVLDTLVNASVRTEAVEMGK
jgi:hypothetical protein